MKKVLMTIAVCLSLTALSAQSDADITYLIDGRFYAQMPASLQPECIAARDKIVDADGNVFCEIVLKPGCTLAANEVPQALPAARVPNGEQVLQQRNRQARAGERPAAVPRTVVPDTTLAVLHAGDRLEAFSVTDTEGTRWNETNTLGKPLVLSFWAIDCAPCLAQMPELSRWLAVCPDVNYLAVTRNTAAQIDGAVKKRNFLFRQVPNDRTLFEMFGIKQLPATVLVDKRGFVRMIVSGTDAQKRAELLKELKELEEK